LKWGQIDSKTADAGNSDPDKLREKAAELVKLSAEELLKRQMEIKVKRFLQSSWKFSSNFRARFKLNFLNKNSYF
jgi:hypothetical protein